MSLGRIVVVGGGFAGITAAMRAVEAGAAVTVLERGTDERYPCNSRFAMGFITVANEDVAGDPAVMQAGIARLTGGAAEADLAAALAGAVGEALRWLRGHGIRIMKATDEPAHRNMLAPPVPVRPGLSWQGRGADTALRDLLARFDKAGGRLLRGHRARELVMRDRRCIGVVASHGDETVRLDADAVLIADGGFQANLDLLRRFVSPAPERLLQRNAGTGTGDGLQMAEAVGARLTRMDRFYGHVQSRDAMTNPQLWPYPIADLPLHAGVAVDHTGARFCDEGLGGVAIANAIARLDDPLEAVAVFDHAIWEGRARQLRFPTNPWLVEAGGTLHRAETLEALARGDRDAAVLRGAALRRHHLYDGRHRHRRRLPRPASRRRGDRGAVRRRLLHRRARGRRCRGLHRRARQGVLVRLHRWRCHGRGAGRTGARGRARLRRCGEVCD
jgi:fumarate reductase flavoprotein subunit